MKSPSPFGPRALREPGRLAPTKDGDPFEITTEVRSHWDAYAVAKMRAEDTLLLADGVVAARLFFAFVEVFMSRRYGSNVVPLSLHRRHGADA